MGDSFNSGGSWTTYRDAKEVGKILVVPLTTDMRFNMYMDECMDLHAI